MTDICHLTKASQWNYCVGEENPFGIPTMNGVQRDLKWKHCPTGLMAPAACMSFKKKPRFNKVIILKYFITGNSYSEGSST